MARSLALLLAGALLSVGLLFMLRMASVDTAAPRGIAGSSASEPAASFASGAVPASDTGARLAIYTEAARYLDPDALETEIFDALGSASEKTRVEALLLRLAEVDPQRAVAIAETIAVDDALLVDLFQLWTEADRTAAIAALARVGPPARQRAVAVGLLAVLGNHAAGIEAIASALAPGERANFEVDALAALAEVDMQSALARMADMKPPAKYDLMVARIGAIAAADPLTSLARAEALLGDGLQAQRFAGAIIDAWSELDPEGVFRYLESAGAEAFAASSAALERLAGLDPQRLLAAGLFGLPSYAQAAAEQAAFRSLAAQDPVLALAALEEIPRGQSYDALLGELAAGYAESDPYGALSWAKSLNPPNPDVLAGVMGGIASNDPELAIDWVLGEMASPGGATLPASFDLNMTRSLMAASPQSIGRLLNAVIDMDPGRSGAISSTLMLTWADTDPEGASSWAIANAETLAATILSSSMIRTVARVDLESAMRVVDSVSPDARDAWLSAVAQELASADPDRALEYVNRYRGQRGYDSAYTAVISTLALQSPERAAQLLEAADDSQGSLAAALSVSRSYAEKDPVAAAEWALRLNDNPVKTSVVGNVTEGWLRSDPEAARAWAIGLDRGASRDAALGAVLRHAVNADGTIDTPLLQNFSTAQARDEALGSAIVQLGRTDLDTARQLMDEHIADPDVRRQTEANLARTSGASGFEFNVPSLLRLPRQAPQ